MLKRKLRDNNLEHTLHNLPAGDWAAGERGIACIPGREEEFRDGVAAAIRYARALGNKKINCLVGKTPSGFSATEIHDTLVENLRYAANMLAKEDILLLIEPINHFDMPGFHLTGTQQALALIKDIGSDNIKIQYDIYHMQRMEGELTQTMTAWADKIAIYRLLITRVAASRGPGKLIMTLFLMSLNSLVMMAGLAVNINH